jgi:hypothetical protein
MSILKLIEILELVSPLVGVNSEKIKLVVAILKIIMADEK